MKVRPHVQLLLFPAEVYLMWFAQSLPGCAVLLLLLSGERSRGNVQHGSEAVPHSRRLSEQSG